MPGLIAINNTYTANTPQGVRDCLYFLQQQGRDSSRRSAEDRFRSFPISIVYGCGIEIAADGLLATKGDDLDIVPTRWDTIRRRRWWDVSRVASKQMLLPFPEHAYVRITRISRYSHSTELTIQIGSEPYSQLNLVAPRNMRSAPGLYTVRAIRIHNVDGSETVLPMQPVANDTSYQQSQRVRGAAGAPTAYINGDWGNTLHNNVPYSAEECEAIDDTNWRTAVNPGPCREQPVESNPCGEQPVEANPCVEVAGPRPRRPAGEAPMWEAMPEPPTPPPTRPRGPRSRRVTRTVPIREIVSREDVDRAEREARDYQMRRLRSIESQEGVGDESCRLRGMPRDITEAQARALHGPDFADRAREDVESCRVIPVPVAERVENYRRAYGGVNEAREDVESCREVPATEAETRYQRHRITPDVDWSGFTDQVDAFVYASQAIGRCVRNDTS